MKKANGKKRKPAPLEKALAIDVARLKRARTMIENVLWNIEHNAEEPLLRDTEAWRRIFNDLRETLG